MAVPTLPAADTYRGDARDALRAPTPDERTRRRDALLDGTENAMRPPTAPLGDYAATDKADVHNPPNGPGGGRSMPMGPAVGDRRAARGPRPAPPTAKGPFPMGKGR